MNYAETLIENYMEESIKSDILRINKLLLFCISDYLTLKN
jgi:hypothetical protein